MLIILFQYLNMLILFPYRLPFLTNMDRKNIEILEGLEQDDKKIVLLELVYLHDIFYYLFYGISLRLVYFSNLFGISRYMMAVS